MKTVLYTLKSGEFTYRSQVGELLETLRDFGARVSYAWIALPYGVGHSVRIEEGKTVWFGDPEEFQLLGNSVFGKESIFINADQLDLWLPYVQTKNLKLNGHLEFEGDERRFRTHLTYMFKPSKPTTCCKEEEN